MRKLFFLLLMLILISCDHRVKFSSAMPPEVEDLASIPESFLGTFICESDSSRLMIDKFSAVQESYYLFETTVARIKETENCSIADGGLYLPGRKTCIPFEYLTEDSIRAKVYEIDTLFAFRKNEIAKYDKGHLFINYKNDLAQWDTWIFTPQEDGNILFEFVAVPDNERKIKDVTNNYIKKIDDREKVHYTLNPTKKEFDEIINKGYLFECDILIPVNFENDPF
ncbi:MAG: hypothetical protein HKO66_02135 [Saprospiraceae bacterium]|nr:hypothetical protein [Bacteroidia bacterium]NNE14697.1 hypothetical protein [Saprospiraceae bacterium]NNL91011.1 hypothetical protein [Saprospiraceae bacterium]